MVSAIGIILIIIGWIVQFNSKSNKIQINFLKFYLAGVAILVIDSYLSNLKLVSLLNLVSLGTAGMLFIKIKDKK